MKKGNENIDQLFKDAFAGEQFPMDEALWNDVKGTLPIAKKTNGGFYLASGIIALIAITSALWLTIDTSKIDYSYEERQSQSNLFASVSNESFLVSNESEAFYPSELTVSKVNTNPVQISNPTHTNKNIQEGTNTKGTSSLMNEKDSPSSKKSNSVVEESMTIASLSAIQKANNTKSASSIQPVGLSNYNNPSANSTNFKTFKALEETSTNQVIANPNEEIIQLEPSTPLVSLNDYSSKTPELSQNTKERKTALPLQFKLLAGAGLGFTYNNSDLPSELNFTSNHVEIAFDVSYNFNPRIGIQSGLHYVQYDETQNYSSTTSFNLETIEVTDNSYWNYQDLEVVLTDSTWFLGGWWYFDPYTDTIVDSNYVSVLDSVINTEKIEETTSNEAKNRVRYFEIPVLFTYSIWHKRWNFQFAAGPSFGFYLNSDGKLINLNEPMQPTAIDKSVLNALQYNMVLQTDISYAVSDRWNIIARPNIRMNLNSGLSNAAPYQPKYFRYGLNVGVGFHW